MVVESVRAVFLSIHSSTLKLIHFKRVVRNAIRVLQELPHIEEPYLRIEQLTLCDTWSRLHSKGGIALHGLLANFEVQRS